MTSNSQPDQRLAEFEGGLVQALRQWGGKSLLVAVSGGPDSTALLHGLARLGRELSLRLEVASLDHGLRPEAAREVALVQRQAMALGLPFHTRALGLERRPGLEASAREARYAALEAIRVERSLDFVVTGHTASDQAETLLMRLARGSALGGAAGILERREDRVLRPLLFATREMVESYVRALDLETVRDPMNDETAYLRVRIRRQVLPALETAAGHGVVRALARFAALAAEDDTSLKGQAAQALARVSLDGGALDAVGVRSLERPIRRRALAAWLTAREIPLDGDLIADVLAAVDERRVATLPGDRLLTADRDRLEVVAAPPRSFH